MPDGRQFYYQMSLIFSFHVLMNDHVSIDVTRSVMFQTVCNKSTVLVAGGSVMLWAGIQVGQPLCMW